MDQKQAKQLQLIAYKARLEALKALFAAASGHIGGSFSAMEILTTLYFDKMNIDPKDPKNPDRDRFVLSKGHCTPALYSVLALRGYFPLEWLAGFRQISSDLSGHAEMKHVPGVDMSTGSLGQGLSVAVGMALGAKIDHKSYTTYALMGDGEIAEGQIWEASMAAAKFQLDNLIGFVDVNGLQIDGATKDVMPSEPLDKKFEAFGWHVIKVDGQDIMAIADAIDQAKTVKGKPTMILAKTTKGKGVSYMENNAGWHGKAPNAEQFEQAKAELLATIAKLEVE